MIGGMMIILVAIWVYQSLIQAKKENPILWVAACAAVFFHRTVSVSRCKYLHYGSP